LADVVLTRRDPDAALRSALHAEFTEAEIAELTLTVAMAVGFSKSAIAWGPEPQLPTMQIPTPGS
jgi:alkylhydroperoxidase family enzyme